MDRPHGLSGLPDVRSLERRLDRLSAEAAGLCARHARAKARVDQARDFLAKAPLAAATLEELTKALFGELLDEIEAGLTHAVREILGQDRQVRTERQIRNNRLFVTFFMENQGEREDVLVGQGGSVCNILSVSLRLIALSQLDPARHRPFLVLDEQDCWLKPELVPMFMKLIHQTAHKLGLQVLVISHHPVDHFVDRAESMYRLRPSRDKGVAIEKTAG